MIRTLIAAAALTCAATATAAPGSKDPAAVVEAFAAAQASFDQAALDELTAPDYVEISPLGEVDPRARMLGFYAPDKKQPVPAIVTTERTVRVTGGLAIVTQRQAYGERALRGVFVLRRDAAKWRLVSVQYTPIRIKPAS